MSDLAREVRYRYFDRPFFEQIQSQVYANAEAQLAAAGREIPGRSLEQRDASARFLPAAAGPAVW